MKFLVMKNSIFTISIFSVLCLFFACAGDSTTSSSTAANSETTVNTLKSKDQLVKEISAAEAELFKDKDTKEKFNFDFKKAETLVGAYESFINSYPEEADVPNYLFKSAELYRSLRNFNKSNNCYSKILKDFPGFEKAAHSLFLMGFSYENDMNMPEKAKEIYQQFLAKYPDHELKDDVEFSLRNIGKTPEEIIKEFEKNRKK